MKPFEIQQKLTTTKYIPKEECVPGRLKQYMHLKYDVTEFVDEYLKTIENKYKSSFIEKLFYKCFKKGLYYKYFRKGFIKGFINGIDTLREIYVQEEVSQERLEKFLRFLVKENLYVSKDPMGRIMIADAEKTSPYFIRIIEEISKNENISNE